MGREIFAAKFVYEYIGGAKMIDDVDLSRGETHMIKLHFDIYRKQDLSCIPLCLIVCTLPIISLCLNLLVYLIHTYNTPPIEDVFLSIIVF